MSQAMFPGSSLRGLGEKKGNLGPRTQIGAGAGGFMQVLFEEPSLPPQAVAAVARLKKRYLL